MPVTISYLKATYLICYCFTMIRNPLNERLLPLSAVDHCLCTLKMVNGNMDKTASRERKLTLFPVGVTVLCLESLWFCFLTLYVEWRNIAPKGFDLFVVFHDNDGSFNILELTCKWICLSIFIREFEVSFAKRGKVHRRLYCNF